MKIEKLTEDKIRVIIAESDLKIKNTGNYNIFGNILEILESANKQVGFNTDGCKLLIETVPSFDDAFVFTVTKYSTSSLPSKNLRTLKPPKPAISLHSKRKASIYSFKTFDDFCDFCYYIYNIPDFKLQDFCKDMTLFLYENTYYLVAKDANCSFDFMDSLDSIASEFRNCYLS